MVIKLLPITCTMYKWLPYYANSSWIFAKEGILWWQHAHYASLHMLALHPTSSSKTSMLCKDQVLCKFTSMEDKDKDTSCKFQLGSSTESATLTIAPLHCIVRIFLVSCPTRLSSHFKIPRTEQRNIALHCRNILAFKTRT